MVKMNGNTSYSRGVLLATQDGGKTWAQPGVGPPIAEAPRFLTLKQGWLAGGPTLEQGIALYATSAGGGSWQIVLLKAPQQMQPTASIDKIYPLVSQDSQHLFVPVAFREPDEKQPTLVLFASNNGGQTWAQDATLPNYTSVSETTVAGSTWITATISGTTLTLTKIALGAIPANGPATTVSANIGRISGGSASSQLSFANDSQGWMLAAGNLLATTNGGVTWTDITPVQARASERY